jgi:antitoxin component of MazEF toxin-antitoxin module
MRMNEKMSVVKYRTQVTRPKSKLGPICGVTIPTDLAAAAGIKPGDLVKVAQGRGKIVISRVKV